MSKQAVEAAGETGQSASDVLHASGELSEQAEKLRGKVDRFVQSLD